MAAGSLAGLGHLRPIESSSDAGSELRKSTRRSAVATLVSAVIKVKENGPQKEQQNRFHQCHSLDGVFAIGGQVREGAVLLVDDVVDSRWTLTIIAALLRQAGCAAVWPFALATASVGA